METQVRTPQSVFNQPQRLLVPLFQRPYVWNEDHQWDPLWKDVVRVADGLMQRPNERHHPHFLGAVVLQQVQNPIGVMQARTIIDGQQRLTTLQLLLDALHSALLAAGTLPAAMRIEALVTNSEHFCLEPEDRFKVWPTNRDRPAFNAVMGAKPPIDYDGLGYGGERMLEAHRFFSEQAHEWLHLNGPEAVAARATAIDSVVRDLLQIVVIDLAIDENAQEIFETLNARGAQLTAADLVKNFVFQRLMEYGADVEAVYEGKWKEFETAFWETEIGVGRFKHPRSSVFLNHWLVARTGEDVLAREVFDRFKRFSNDTGIAMLPLVEQIHRASRVYRDFVAAASVENGPLDRLALFGYRTSVLESEVIKPFVLCLLDPEQTPIPRAQLEKAFDSVESWMVRRMLVRATTKNYNQVMSELVDLLRHSDRSVAGDVVERFLASQTSGSRYWPDDTELREELETLLAYRRLGRGRLRMVIEAVEDYKRGWRDGKTALSNDRVMRGKHAIEHIMPRKWATHWPLPEGQDEADRDRIVHTLGNLTLLTGRLNSKVSNGPWIGKGGKREGLEGHDVLFLNRELVREAPSEWTEASIRQRTRELVAVISKIWNVPDNHKSGFSSDKAAPRRHKIGLSDLLSAGLLTAGMPLFRRNKKNPEQVGTLLADGRIEINGKQFARPSEAATSITGHSTNGWAFLLVQQSPRRSLKDVWRDYVDSMAVDAEDEADDSEDEEA